MNKKNLFASIFITLASTFLCRADMTPFGAKTREYAVPFMARYRQEIDDPYVTFYEWKSACDTLPHFKEGEDNPYATPLTEKLFVKQLTLFPKVMQQIFSNVLWLNNDLPRFNEEGPTFESYIQKIEVPTDAIIAIHGDIHGDIHALNRFVETFLKRGYLDDENPFKIKAQNFYMLFLGDYVDRGWYGPEVIYTILRLKAENPDRVFMIRGNHEDLALSVHGYGFGDVIIKKFHTSRFLERRIGRMYDMLPLALYISAGVPGNYNIIQCCHGGIELGVDPRPLLETTHANACMKIDTLMQEDGFAHLAYLGLAPLKRFFKNNKPLDTTNGFMWTDFIVDKNKIMTLSSRDGESGNLFEYGKKATEQLLRVWSGSSYTLRAIFRGHQHDFDSTPMRRRILNDDQLSHPLDAGAGKLWIENGAIHQIEPALLRDVSVVTFSVAPETGYGWPFHSFAQLTIAPQYDDWRLHIFRVSQTS